MRTPNYTQERAHGGLVAGLDEAGRGPWAGPVVAAIVLLDPKRIPPGLDDSKALSKARRETLHDLILARAKVGVGQCSPQEIDRVNILQATFLAMQRAHDALGVMLDLALIDGNQLPKLPCVMRGVIGGDALCSSIAAASIIAKVTRDRLMAELARDHPHYGWERNAGYGTREHQAALAAHGPSPHHRMGFAPLMRLAARAG